jgi:hypothetical protein
VSKSMPSLAVLCATLSFASLTYADDAATPGQGANAAQAPATEAAPTAATPVSSGNSTMTPASAEPAAAPEEAAGAKPDAQASPAATEDSAGSAAPHQEEESTETKPAQPTAAPQAQTADDRIVCKRVEQTGTRLRKGKVCKTLSQWRAQEAAARKILTDADKRGAPGPGGQTLPTG